MPVRNILLIAFLFISFTAAQAQDNTLITTDQPVYHYINQLQHRGYLLDLNPTSLPYTHEEIKKSVQSLDRQSLGRLETRWVDLVKSFLEIGETEPGLRGGVHIEAGTYLGNSRRMDMVRALDNDLFAYPFVDFSGYIEARDFIANAGLRHSVFYDRDPDGLDAANRLLIRSEDAYLGYNGEWLNVYIGRFDNQWAPFGATSTILSTNPYSFDQINIRFGNDKVSLRSIIGELDNISADGVFTGRDFGEGSKRRFYVAHRFDWRPTPHFGVALFESVIYSGENSGFSFKYINPLHSLTFVADNNPKNDENNLLLGGMLWVQWQGFTFNTQLMIDDLQIEPATEKHNYAFTASVYKARLFANVDLDLAFEAVTHQAYVSEQSEGRYVFLKKGLATQFNDYILSSVQAPVFSGGFTFTPGIEWLLQGEQEINQPQVKTNPDGTPIDFILTGNEEQTIRPSVAIRYQSGPSFWIEGDAGVNFIQDFNNQPGVDRTRFAGFLRFAIDFSVF